MGDSIEGRARFDLVRYANCWEDARVLRDALHPGPRSRILSIASGGDNCFLLVAAGAEVVAVDLSAAQLACVELKAAAIRALGRDDLLAFLGVHPSEDREEVYASVRTRLSQGASRFWDQRSSEIKAGILHSGKFERYFRTFRTKLLPLLHGRKTVRRLMEPKSAEERQWFYDRVWNTWRWRLLFRVFFGRFVMGRLGRDPEFFRYVEGPVGPRILNRVEYALTVLPTNDNPYLEYVLNGNYAEALPDYLDPEVLPRVRDGLDRLTLVEGPAEEIATARGGSGFDGFNLSDIFEYLPMEACARIYGSLLRAARPGARLVYWNMLVPRRLALLFPDEAREASGAASELFARDRAFFYQDLVVDEARGSSRGPA